MDIVLHCVDQSHLKSKGLCDVFPAICRYNQVTHCPATRRIAGEISEDNFSFLYKCFDCKRFSICSRQSQRTSGVVRTPTRALSTPHRSSGSGERMRFQHRREIPRHVFMQ